jgi:hypothetical protein
MNQCLGFTFVDPGSVASTVPTCYLKDRVGQYTVKSSAWSGVLIAPGAEAGSISASAMAEPMRGVDYTYGDLDGDHNKSSVEKCSKACLLRSECVAFTFVPHAKSDRRCWLKYSTEGRTSADSRISSAEKATRTFDPIKILTLSSGK